MKKYMIGICKIFLSKLIKLLIWSAIIYLLLQFKHYWIGCTKSTSIFVLFIASTYIILSLIKKIHLRAKKRAKYLNYLRSDIRYVDTLSGIEFEEYLKVHFKNKGYRVFLTPPQKDYGVDLVIKKGKDVIAVQAKRYNHEQGYKVTYRAVQEVAAGKAYYNCNKGIVVTNSFFTKSAAELAKCNNIELWDRKRMIEEFKAINSPRLYQRKEKITMSF